MTAPAVAVDQHVEILALSIRGYEPEKIADVLDVDLELVTTVLAEDGDPDDGHPVVPTAIAFHRAIHNGDQASAQRILDRSDWYGLAELTVALAAMLPAQTRYKRGVDVIRMRTAVRSKKRDVVAGELGRHPTVEALRLLCTDLAGALPQAVNYTRALAWTDELENVR